MSDDTTKTAASAPVKQEGDHDRVTMLSLRADGTPDQTNPELIGDKEAALAVTRRQFAEQAVSVVDIEKRRELGLIGSDEGDTSDPIVDELTEAHEKAATAADKRADKVVSDLHKG